MVTGRTETEILKYTQVECIPVYSVEIEHILILILMCSDLLMDIKYLKKNELYHITDYLNVKKFSFYISHIVSSKEYHIPTKNSLKRVICFCQNYTTYQWKIHGFISRRC